MVFSVLLAKTFCHLLESGELNISLKTGDYRCALHRARVLRLGLEALMTQFTPAMSKTDTEALVRGWINARLWRQEAHRAETGGFDLLETEEVERMGDQNARELNALMRLGTNLICDEQKQAIRRTLAGQEPLDGFAPVFDLAARDLGIPIDRTTADGRLLARTVLRGHATFLDEVRQAIAAIPHQVQAMVAKPALPTFEFALSFWQAHLIYRLS